MAAILGEDLKTYVPHDHFFNNIITNAFVTEVCMVGKVAVASL
jgi:hypothetical protein